MRLRILLLLACVALAGCRQPDRYQLVPAGNGGGVYRLDKQTGEVRLIWGRESYPVAEVQEQSTAPAADASVEQTTTDAQAIEEAWKVLERK